MKKINIFLLSSLSCFSVFGQSGYQANQYMFNHQLINPAYSGKDYKIKGSILANQQLTGIEASPRLVAFSISSPINLSHSSIGLNYTNFSFGVQSNSEINAVYSFKIPLKKYTMVLGMQGGLINIAQTNSKLKTGQSGDERFQNSYSGSSFNFGTGLYFFNKNSFLSLSAPSWFQHEFNTAGQLERNFSKSKMPIFISAGVEYRIGKNFWMDPYCLLRTYQNGRTMMDLNLIFDYKNMVWAGPFYKTESQIGCIIGLKLNNYLKLNYSGAISQQYRKGFIGSANEISIVFTIKDKLKVDAISPRLF